MIVKKGGIRHKINPSRVQIYRERGFTVEFESIGEEQPEALKQTPEGEPETPEGEPETPEYPEMPPAKAGKKA